MDFSKISDDFAAEINRSPFFLRLSQATLYGKGALFPLGQEAAGRTEIVYRRHLAIDHDDINRAMSALACSEAASI